MDINELDYDLPRELIAQHPLTQRDSSRLMTVRRGSGEIQHGRFHDITRFLESGTLLVLNNTKVIPARLSLRRNTGGRVDTLLVTDKGNGVWDTLLNSRGRLSKGEKLFLPDGKDTVTVGRSAGGFREIIFGENNDVHKIMSEWGCTPLPPYIKRNEKSRAAEDIERYQTVYAEHPGSVAAPTAGLHFTGKILTDLRSSGIETAMVTLHVGPGTFLPIKSENIEDHEMHAEYFEIPPETMAAVRSAKNSGRKVMAVGTTTCRVLESAGVDGAALSGWTSLFIHPPFEFKIVDALLTNFHLPRSTLLLLVYAFGGTDLIRDAYLKAVEEKYRFYSYGDAMLIG